MGLDQLVDALSEFGFPVVLSIGMGYFIYYIWWFIENKLNPALDEMHRALIRVIDQSRMMDQDLIRLQQKVNVILEYREKDELNEKNDDL